MIETRVRVLTIRTLVIWSLIRHSSFVIRISPAGVRMARERIISGQEQPDDKPLAEAANPALRPRKLNEYIGQPELIEKVRIAVEAAKKRGEPMEDVLL